MIERLSPVSIPYFQFVRLSGYDQIRHAVFTRRGGVSLPPYDTLNLSVSVPDDQENVLANRSRAYSIHQRTNDTLVHAYLIHGSNIARVTQKDNARYVGPVDGLITNEPGCGLTMNFADCAPILLYDPVRQAIGLGHAGWQGVIKDLPGSLVRGMTDAFGSSPGDIIAGIGPCIDRCCYEVGRTVISAVENGFSDGQSLLIPPSKNGSPETAEEKKHFDLPEANRRRLEQAGVKKIESSGLCTACRTDLFFSHRAEKGQTGRFGALLILL